MTITPEQARAMRDAATIPDSPTGFDFTLKSINADRALRKAAPILATLYADTADMLAEVEAENKRLREAGTALIDFHNGPAEAKRPDIWQRLLQRFANALEETK